MAPAGGKRAAYTAYSEGDDQSEDVIKTLAGDYAEIGANHGRPTFKKIGRQPGEPVADVFLYFWDERDGADLAGWWFGKEVGGDDIWAQNRNKALRPPMRGWHIPHSGPVRESFLVAPKDPAPAAPAAPVPKRAGPVVATPYVSPTSMSAAEARPLVGAADPAEQANVDDMINEAIEMVAEIEEAFVEVEQAGTGPEAQAMRLETQAQVRSCLVRIGKSVTSAKNITSKELRERATKELGALRTRLLQASSRAKGIAGRPEVAAGSGVSAPWKATTAAAAARPGPGKGGSAAALPTAAAAKRPISSMATPAQREEASFQSMLEEVSELADEMDAAAEAAMHTADVSDEEAKVRLQEGQALSRQVLSKVWKKTTEIKAFTIKEVRERANDEIGILRARILKAGAMLRQQAKAVLEGGNGDAEVPSGPKPPATPPPNGPKGLGKAAGVTAPKSSALRISIGAVPVAKAAWSSGPLAKAPSQAKASAAPEAPMSARKPATNRYSAYDETGKGDADGVIDMLSGEFFQKGFHHGRPAFQKSADKGPPPDIFLFFWDARDGAEHEGWYFSDAIGNVESWAFAKSKAMVPPKKGWRIPTTGAMRITFVVAPTAEQKDSDAQPAGASKLLKPGPVAPAGDPVEHALPKDRALWKDTVEQATAQHSSVEEVVDKIASACDAALDAEDAGGEDAEATRRKAINEAAALHESAAVKLKEIFALITKSMVACKGFTNPVLRAKASKDLGQLRLSLAKENERLKGFADIEGHLKQRAAAKKQISDEKNRYAIVEAELARATEVCQPILVEDKPPSAELIKQAGAAIDSATAKLTPTMRTMKTKLTLAKGLLKDELTSLFKKATLAEQQLGDLRAAQRRCQEKVVASIAISEVSEQIRAFQEAIALAEAAMAPFAAGAGEMPVNDIRQVADKGDEAMRVAAQVGGQARLIVTKRYAEVQRMQDESSKEVKERVKAWHDEMQTLVKRLNDLRTTTKVRRDEALRAEPLKRVSDVEALGTKIKEKGELINEEGKLSSMEPSQIREAAVAVRAFQAELLTEMQAAQKLLVSRQIDAKKRNSMGEQTELARLQERLRSVQTQANAFRILPAPVERHLATQKHIDEAAGKVEAAEEALEKALKMISDLSRACEPPAEGEEPPPQPMATVEEADAATNAASVHLAGVFRFLAGTAKAKGVPEEDVQKLQQRIKDAQERLKDGRAALSAVSEKKAAENLLAEADAEAKAADAAVEKATELANALLEESGELSAAKEGLVAPFKEAAKAAQLALKRASSTIAEKQKVAKEFTEAVAESTLKEFGSMKEFVDLLAQDMADIHKDASDRIYGNVRRDIDARFKLAEVKTKLVCQVCEELAERTAEGKAEINASEMQELLDRGSQAYEEGAALITEMISTLQGHLRDLEASEAPAKKDFKLTFTKLVQMESQSKKQQRELVGIEQRFVAKHVLNLAGPMVEELEAKMEHLTAVSAPLMVEEEKVAFNAIVLLARVGDALRAHAAAKSLTPQALFDEMREGAENIAEAKFIAFVRALPHLKEHDLSDAQVKAAYTALDSVGGGRVTEGQFFELIRRRFLVLGEAPLRATCEAHSDVTRTLAVHDVVEASEPAPTSSDVAAKVRVEVDGSEGFVFLGDTSFFEPFSPYSACSRKAELATEEVAVAVKKTMTFLQQKGADFKALAGANKTAAIREAEDGLMRLRARAARSQANHATLKKKLTDMQAERAKKMKMEAQRREQAAKVAAAAAAAKEVSDIVDAAVGIADKAATAAGCALKAAAAASEGQGAEARALELVEAAAQELQAASSGASVASAKLAERTASTSDMTLKKLLQASSTKVSSIEARCRQQSKALYAARSRLARAAEKAVHDVVKARMRSLGTPAPAIFDKLSSKGAGQVEMIPAAAFRSFLEENSTSSLEATQLDLGLRRYAQGVPRLAFLDMAQDYRSVVKPIVLTSALAVQDSKILRKLELGEVVEVLGEIATDPQVGLERARCRAMREADEGWITLRGNQGTPFFEVAPKPYLLCKAEEVPLRRACSRMAEAARSLRGGDALEVLEGPVREAAVEVARVRGRAKKDGRMGWVTLRDGAGAPESLQLVDALICRCSIALTKDFDAGAIVRKLELGELLDKLEEPQEEPTQKLQRVRARARSDGKEGWVTMMGTNGTQYVAENSTIYTCAFDVPMESSFPSGGTRIRTLEEGEAFDVLEGPTIEKKVGESFARCRSLRDDSEGWICVDASVESWAPRYTCRRSGELQEEVDSPDGADIVRHLEAFEPLEVLSPPTRSFSGVRLHVRAERDGVVGWTTLRQQGADEALLECVLHMS